MKAAFEGSKTLLVWIVLSMSSVGCGGDDAPSGTDAGSPDDGGAMPDDGNAAPDGTGGEDADTGVGDSGASDGGGTQACAAEAGSLDATFGDGGLVRFSAFSGTAKNASVAVQPDQMILVAGQLTSQDELTLARLRADGTMDAAFGTGGVVSLASTHPGAQDVAGLLVRDDGGILVVTEDQAALFDNTGALNGGFGEGGVTAIPTTRGIAMQDDGKVLLAGEQETTALQYDSVLARLLADGSFDPSFGTDGVVVVPLPGNGISRFWDVVETGDRLIAAGVGAQSEARFMGFDRSGTVDASFGENGEVVRQLGEAQSEARHVLVDGASGNVPYAAFYRDFAMTGGSTGTALGSMTPDGELIGSRSRVDGPLEGEGAPAGLVQTTHGGLFIATSLTRDESRSRDMALVRFEPTEAQPGVFQRDTAFGEEGIAAASTEDDERATGLALGADHEFAFVPGISTAAVDGEDAHTVVVAKMFLCP